MGPDDRGGAMTDFDQGLALGRPSVWRDGLQGITEATQAPFALPAGTVTFLLSDIEGSTRLWEAYAKEMAHAVPAHYALLCDAVGRHGGCQTGGAGRGRQHRGSVLPRVGRGGGGA